MNVSRALVIAGLLAGCTTVPDEPPAEVVGPTGGAGAQTLTSPGSSSGGPIALSRSAAPGRPVGSPDIVLGTGQFVNQPSTAGSVGLVPGGSDVTLDFDNVDVRVVLKSVLGDLLRLSYTIEPSVQGTITLHTGRPMPRSALLNVLTDALQLTGVALVERDGMFIALPAANGTRQASPGGRAGIVTRIVTPQYVSASDLERALEPTLPAGATLKADAARNTLMVSGSLLDIARIMENINTFDADFMRGMSFGLIPLRYGRARDIAGDVTKMIAASGRSAADIVRIIPIDRINAVLVTSMQPAYIQRVRGWVDRFDRGDGRAEPKLYVYRVQNGRATDLARVLRRALGLDPAGAGDADHSTSAPSPAIPFTTGSTSTNGSGAGRAVQTQPAQPNTAVPAELRARPDPLASVSAVAAAAESGSAAPSPFVAPDLRITADPTNNALIIAATAQDYAQIEAALQKLDIPPLQVLIEATVAEVTLSNQLSLGLQYFFKTGNFQGIFAPGVAARAGAAAGQATVDTTFPGFGFLSGGNFVYSSGDTTILLQTLAKLTTVRVLSSPNLMVLNNGVARLQVGDQVPIATQSATSTLTSTAQTVNSIDYRDTGIILNVIPRVNASGLVLLDISEEVSDVAQTTSSTLNSPTISQRRVTSSVAVHDGQTIGLAGLIKDRTDRSNSGLPWLKDIPVLGLLFGVRGDATTRTELLVLITPRVVRSRDEGDAVTRELREKVRLTIPIAAGRR